MLFQEADGTDAKNKTALGSYPFSLGTPSDLWGEDHSRVARDGLSLGPNACVKVV